MIHNPIFTGFHADPSICRKGEDIYIAVSSFEWFPGIPVYHSRDMKHWELYSHVLTNDNDPVLRGLPSAKGIWAPCMTYSETDDLFYVVYGVMNSMNARYFDVDNYVVTAKDPAGPWSKPVYVHSAGFDASMFHDTDGRKYLVTLEWETRTEYEKPGPICLVEYDPIQKKIVGDIRRIYRGGTDRGCIEAPHITKHGEYYYLMCAEGGTGYYHGVTMARSKNIWGPYEADPTNPIVTSNPADHNERADWDHLKPRYFNPDSYLQKSGHGSYVELDNGEVWMAHLTARPFRENLRCTLGRETALQRMNWTEDGWLRMEEGGNLAREYVKESALPEYLFPEKPEQDDFDSDTLARDYYTPRIDSTSFVDLKSRPGWLRMRGQESGTSLNRTSIIAKKLPSIHAEATTALEFVPTSYQHTAGLIVYYDNMNFYYLHKYYSEKLQAEAIAIIGVDNGAKAEYLYDTCRAPKGKMFFRVAIEEREMQFLVSGDGKLFEKFGPVFDTSKLSDEYSEYGEFTGTFVGISCGDRMTHSKTADFDFFELKDLKESQEPPLLRS